jgi:hypothetical protein
MKSTNKVNPDLDKERRMADIDVEKMKLFLGELTYSSLENYKQIQIYSRNKQNLNFRKIHMVNWSPFNVI